MVDLVWTESTTPSLASPLRRGTRPARSHGSRLRACRRCWSPPSTPPKDPTCSKRGWVPNPRHPTHSRRLRCRYQVRVRIPWVLLAWMSDLSSSTYRRAPDHARPNHGQRTRSRRQKTNSPTDSRVSSCGNVGVFVERPRTSHHTRPPHHPQKFQDLHVRNATIPQRLPSRLVQTCPGPHDGQDLPVRLRTSHRWGSGSCRSLSRLIWVVGSGSPTIFVVLGIRLDTRPPHTFPFVNKF